MTAPYKRSTRQNYGTTGPTLAAARMTPAQVGINGRKVLTNNPGNDGWSFFAGMDASSALTTTGMLYGVSSLKAVSQGATGTSNVAGMKKYAQTAMDLTANDVEVLFRVPSSANLTSTGAAIVAQLGNSSMSAYYQQTLYLVSNGPVYVDGELYRCRFTCPNVAKTGSPTRSAITDLAFYAVDAGNGGKVEIDFQQVSLVPKMTSRFPNGVCSLTYDDGWASQLTATQDRAVYGYPATFYPIINTLDTSAHITTAQLKQLRDAMGDEIGGHAYTYQSHDVGFHTLTPAQAEQEIAGVKTWMRRNGFASESFAYPKGFFSNGVLDTARRYFSAARTVTGTPIETIPPADPARIKSLSIAGTNNLAVATAAIDAAKAQGQWLVFTFHEVSTTPVGATSTTPAIHQGIMSYLNSVGMPVMTVGSALQAMMQ